MKDWIHIKKSIECKETGNELIGRFESIKVCTLKCTRYFTLYILCHFFAKKIRAANRNRQASHK